MRELQQPETRLEWLEPHQVQHSQVDAEQWSHFTTPGSLTKHLRQITHNVIEHRLFHDNWGEADHDEHVLLDLHNGEQAWLREIEWIYEESRWVYARVTIPKTTAMNNDAILTKLGNGSLGDVIFTDPNLQREKMLVCKIPAGHSLFNRACQQLDETPLYLWARKSRFFFFGQPLLVTEIFLPSFFNFIGNLQSA